MQSSLTGWLRRRKLGALAARDRGVVMRAVVRVAVVSAGLLFASASQVEASTLVGETFSPDAAGPSCSAGYTRLQAVSPGDGYVVPAPGVITAWSFEANAGPPTLRLKVGRPLPGDNFTIVGESSMKNPAANQLSTFTDVRIPVETGDVIGSFTPTEGWCAEYGAVGYEGRYVNGDAPLGSTQLYDGEVVKLDISARVEPDADSDGYGDETQDGCPTDPATQSDCDAPETTITKRPGDKIGKPKAKYAFTSDEPGSTFECRLKGRGLKDSVKHFGPCASPKRYKHLDPGKYRFAVRATDQAGNTDASPAKDKFKVVE
jgi:hypothetical protein